MSAPGVRGAAAPAEPTVWAALLDGLPAAAWLVALDGLRVVAANDAALALFGQPRERLLGTPAAQLAGTPEDLAYWQAAAAGEHSRLHSDTVVAGADGRLRHVSRSIRPVAIAPAGGDVPSGAPPTHALVVLTDRSAERRAEDERELLLGELQSTLEATADGILVTDLGGRVRAFNRRCAELWGMPLELLQAHDDAAIMAWMQHSVGDAAGWERRLRALREAPRVSATDRVELLSGRVLECVTRPLLQGGCPRGRVWSFRDLTERLAAQERIEALSHSDALTGLANRARLAERVAGAAAAVRRQGGGFALLLVDLDRFRSINESLGQAAGDRVLLDVGQRLGGCLRQDDLLARLGADQFALLLDQADARAAEATARRVLHVVAQPFDHDEAPFTLTCSIGIALAPAHGWSLDDLLRHAESAMRGVKAAGRAHFRLHEARVEVDRRQHMRLDHAMRQALVSNRFRLLYQPQVRLADGAIVGAEALLRWRDPEQGEMSPISFIPVAEDSGFIVAIGDWVLTQAVRQAALWHQRGHAMPVAVNVSALQFRQAGFVDRVAGVLAVSGLPPRLLELELTESILVHDADEAMQRLHALATLGVRLSIDDFGTGYSSLAYLKRFPIGKLKIDRSFVTGLPGDDSDAGIVRAILQVARALGMKVIAEGVETEAQRQFLRDAGCDEMQGWLYAPALDSLSFEQRLAGAAGERAAAAAPVADAAGPLPRIRLVSG